MLPLTYEKLFGEEAKRALDEGDSSDLQDLDALNTSLLESAATDMTQQMTAYYVVTGSVHRHRAAAGDLGERAAEVFQDFATFDAYVRDELDRGRMLEQLNCWEVAMRTIPIGQIAANVMFQLRPDDARDLDEALFAAIDGLNVKNSRGDLCITNLLQLSTAARSVTESGQPCDWQKTGSKLWDRLVGAKSVSYTHNDAASKEFLEWGKFIAISQHELSSAHARDAKPILDAITSLNRFYLVLGRDSTKHVTWMRSSSQPLKAST